MISDGFGGAVIVWEDGRSISTVPYTKNLYAQRVNDFSYSIKGGEASNRPVSYSMEQNYPNPFNPSTAISYQLSAFSHVNLAVYDITGREVAKLVDGFKPAGSYQVIFDAKDCPAECIFPYWRLVTSSRHRSFY
ncbi:MAG: hypothetical protein H8D42_04845 [Candidatus Marinimicrobia bacterium]|nr:hypothetical protein [Candidatus Neomarinimicrobiota bacterium]